MTEETGQENTGEQPPPDVPTQEVGDTEPAGDAAVWKARSRDWERRAKANAEAAQTLETVTQQRDDLQTQLQNAQGELAGLMRTDALREHGLSTELADRVRGDTREEILADVQALVKATGASRAATARTPVEALQPGATPVSDTLAAGPGALARDWVNQKARDR